MRIIGGTCRGHPLKTPQGQDIRPTTDKVRLAIFNALFSRGAVVDAHVLDGFCGTGALGLEALSQGASSAFFCDVSRVSLSLAQDNARALKLDKATIFKQEDVTKIGTRPQATEKFDLVFLDPPYRKNLIEPAITNLKQGDWLNDGAWIVLESEKEWRCPSAFGAIDFEKSYGETIVRFMKI